jgi:hypothetical protein
MGETEYLLRIFGRGGGIRLKNVSIKTRKEVGKNAYMILMGRCG